MNPLRQSSRARIAATIALMLMAAALATAHAQPRAARVRPPPQLDCPRDHLTLYGGLVTRYQRSAGQTVIRIRTDWDTTETVTISHPGSDDPSHWFLLDREPFHADDWPRVEQEKGRLREGMRAAAWVCDDGRNPVVDWQPPSAR